MKWLLAAMVYVALVAAAFTQDGWAWPDALWLVSSLAVCYSVGLAIYSAGARRARAVGFLVGSVALLITVQIAPDGAPIRRIVEAIIQLSPRASFDWDERLRAGNAVATMLAGIVGSVLIAAAYRQCRTAHDDN